MTQPDPQPHDPHANQLERIARLEDGIQRLNAFLGGGIELTETHYRAFRGLEAMRNQLPDLHTPKPWPPGTRFTKLNMKGVLRTYTVREHKPGSMWLMCDSDHGQQVNFGFASNLDRWEMQGVVRRVP